MLRMLMERLRRGAHTLPFPTAVVEFPDRFRGRPLFVPTRCADG